MRYLILFTLSTIFGFGGGIYVYHKNLTKPEQFMICQKHPCIKRFIEFID